MLQVKQNQIVDEQNQPVRLRGTCIGGWMNMENFINGYPGAENGIRAAMAEVLGPGRAHFFFDRWLDYILAEEDIAFIRSTDANVVRLALNYRHFENDAAPFQYEQAGFTRLDRAVQWCAKYGLYVILDLHAAPGWQNPDWHSDNPNIPALLWSHPHFQERLVALWEEFARRYKGNATIAGYDVLNEPHTQPARGAPRTDVLNQVYRRVVAAIRAIDPEHIIFLEGDGFSGRFEGLDAPFSQNLVYSGHSYSPAAFSPGKYPGVINGKYWDRDYMKQSNLRHQAFPFAREHKVPLWMGEFGMTYSGPAAEVVDRLRALNDQLEVFKEFGAHWTTWTYKDVGIMGWVALDPESDYMQLLAPVFDAKRKLMTDSWADWLPSTLAQDLVCQLAHVMEQTIGDADIKPGENLHHLKRATLSGYAAALMQPAWANRFKGMSEAEIDRVLQSFAFKNCRPRGDLLELMQTHLMRGADV